MTLAAGIEIGVMGSSTAGQGALATAAPGTGRAGAASAALLTPISAAGSASGSASGTGSFREGMQSLLDSLSSSAEEAAVTPSDAATTLASGSDLGFNLATKTGNEATAAGAKLSLAEALNGASSSRTTAGAAKAASSSAKEKQSDTEPKKELGKEACTAVSTHPAATETVSTDATSGLIPAVVASPAQSSPADLSSPDPSVEPPTGTAPASLASHSSSNEVSVPAAATAQTTALASGDQAADGDRSPVDLSSAKGVELSPSVSTNALSGSALNQRDQQDVQQADATVLQDAQPEDTVIQTEQSVVRQEYAVSQTDPKDAQEANATVLAASRGTNANQPDKTVQSQSTSVTAIPSQIPAVSTAGSQSLTQKSASSQAPSAAIQHSLDGASTQSLQPVDASSTAIESVDSPDRLAGAASTVAAQSSQTLPITQVAAKQSTTSSGKSSAVSSSRPAREAGKSDSELKAGQLAEGQQVSSVASDSLAVARDASGTHGTVRSASELAQTSATATTSSDSREAFAELDAGDAASKPTWIHAGTQKAEAGYQDPSLGWVSVRADSSGGGVHAQLVAGSTDAAQALNGHLAGLNAYLTEHNTPVETLTLTAPDSGWTGLGSGQGQNMQHGAGQQTGQNADSSSQSNPPGNSMTQPAASEAAVFQSGLDGSAVAAGAGGVHVSVMA